MTPAGDFDNSSVDPRFVDEAGGDFHLKGNSPLLAYTDFLGDSGPDLDGSPVPASGSMDLGAYMDTIFADVYD